MPDTENQVKFSSLNPPHYSSGEVQPIVRMNPPSYTRPAVLGTNFDHYVKLMRQKMLIADCQDELVNSPKGELLYRQN